MAVVFILFIVLLLIFVLVLFQSCFGDEFFKDEIVAFFFGGSLGLEGVCGVSQGFWGVDLRGKRGKERGKWKVVPLRKYHQ